MKNKKFIYILILCTAFIFLYACNSDTPPEDEDITDASVEAVTTDTDITEIPGETDIESETNGGEQENPGLENLSHSNSEPEADPVSPPVSNDMIKIGYFTVETRQGEAPIFNDDDTITLPNGGTITVDSGAKFTVDSGGVLYCDEKNSPFELSVHDSLRIASGDSDVIIESPNGIILSIDDLTSEEEEPSAEEKNSTSRTSPWVIYFDENQHAVFEFTANGVKCTSLDSIFPMYKDANNGTILFKKCTIELTDGTIIDAPLNTVAKMTEGVFTIIIGRGEASMTKPDGTVSAIPEGTVIDSNF